MPILSSTTKPRQTAQVEEPTQCVADQPSLLSASAPFASPWTPPLGAGFVARVRPCLVVSRSPGLKPRSVAPASPRRRSGPPHPLSGAPSRHALLLGQPSGIRCGAVRRARGSVPRTIKGDVALQVLLLMNRPAPDRGSRAFQSFFQLLQAHVIREHGARADAAHCGR